MPPTTPPTPGALELPLQLRTHRQPAGDDSLHGAEQLQLRSILLGVNGYHRRHSDKVLPLIQDLTEGQNPDTLFVSCVDSRVNPNLITSSGPGDLLTLRNIGNVVCNAGEYASIHSALSFALTGLGVESIVICGHSNCGAMKAVIAAAWTSWAWSTWPCNCANLKTTRSRAPRWRKANCRPPVCSSTSQQHT